MLTTDNYVSARQQEDTRRPPTPGRHRDQYGQTIPGGIPSEATTMTAKFQIPIFSVIASVLMAMAEAHGSVLIPDSNPVAIGFSGFNPPAIWATATPVAGQLDSDTWAWNSTGTITSTAATFGVDQTLGQGSSTGGVTTGGVYAFDVGGSVTALGVQPTGSVFTPGSFTVRLQNTTGTTITDLEVDWTAYYLNDQARGNSFDFYYSANNTSYTDSGVGVLSPAVADVTPTWVSTNQGHTISGLSIPNNGFYYLRWGGDDVDGSGNRDEFGVAGIVVTPTLVPEPTSLALGGIGLVALAGIARSRRKAAKSI